MVYGYKVRQKGFQAAALPKDQPLPRQHKIYFLALAYLKRVAVLDSCTSGVFAFCTCFFGTK